MIKKLFYILLFLLMPSLASASQATLCSWDTPTTCIVSCATYTPPCPVSEPTVTSIGCDALTGYKIYAGTSHGVYTISTSVSVTNSALLSSVTGTLPRGYICIVATALTANAESDYSNEKCYWNLGNYVYSDNATRPTPVKPSGAGPGTYVLDNFNRADANPIRGNWTTAPSAGAIQISGNQVLGVGTSNTIYWNANTFLNNQCSHVTMVDMGATYGGPAVRVSSSQQSYYYFKVAAGGAAYEYGKIVNGTWTQLGTTIAGSPQPNDILTLCISGNVLTGYVNGVAMETRTDNDLASGRAGLTLYGTVTHLDNWAGWDGAILPFVPNQYVQAEAAILSSMATGVSGTDTYVYTSTNNAGYARFTFTITTPGNYKLEARVNSHNSDGQNSFFVGLDNEAAQGNDAYAYDVSLFNVFTWEEVSKRGNGTPTHTGDQYQPMIWNLSIGQHTLTFYGRETNTWLNQIRLDFVP